MWVCILGVWGKEGRIYSSLGSQALPWPLLYLGSLRWDIKGGQGYRSAWGATGKDAKGIKGMDTNSQKPQSLYSCGRLLGVSVRPIATLLFHLFHYSPRRQAQITALSLLVICERRGEIMGGKGGARRQEEENEGQRPICRCHFPLHIA